jgi:hypothetical protein
MTHMTITAANGSRWTVKATTPGFYGRPVPPGREFWALRVDGEEPAELRGVLGFYAATLEAVRERLGVALPLSDQEARAAGFECTSSFGYPGNDNFACIYRHKDGRRIELRWPFAHTAHVEARELEPLP